MAYRLCNETEIYMGIYKPRKPDLYIEIPSLHPQGIYSGFQGYYKFPYKPMASSYKIFTS